MKNYIGSKGNGEILIKIIFYLLQKMKETIIKGKDVLFVKFIIESDHL